MQLSNDRRRIIDVINIFEENDTLNLIILRKFRLICYKRYAKNSEL